MLALERKPVKGAKERDRDSDLRDGLPPDLRHDGALPSKVLKAEAQEAVDYKC